MENNFDKEIDTLLRQSARSNSIVSVADFDVHLDADEISMFAENVLPEKARNKVIKHLAECNDCRSILSNLILLNEETETENVSSAGEKAVQIAAVPWYKKLFIFPQIAYAMGALVLVFSGAIGFLVYQTATKSRSFELAKQTENSSVSNTAASTENSVGKEPDFNAESSNSMTINTNTAANFPNKNRTEIIPSENSNVGVENAPAVKSEQNENVLLEQPKSSVSSRQMENLPAPGFVPKPSIKRENAEESRDDKDESVADSVTSAPPPPQVAAAAPKSNISSRNAESKKNEENVDAKTSKLARNTENRRQIGGKFFNRINGVWIDSAYDKTAGNNLGLPPTISVKRGTSDYLRLDKSIRTIAESLEGPVIIVANNRAYRIQ